MIRFERNGQKDCTRVLARIDTGLPTATPLFSFKWECPDAEYAALLASHLQKRFEDTIKQAHRLAYQRGWEDAKGKKRRKATKFATYFMDSADAIAW